MIIWNHTIQIDGSPIKDLYIFNILGTESRHEVDEEVHLHDLCIDFLQSIMTNVL